jgi:polysaccharide export outer membrane protein
MNFRIEFIKDGLSFLQETGLKNFCAMSQKMNILRSTLRILVFVLLVFSAAGRAAGQKMLVPSPTGGAQPDAILKASPGAPDEAGPALHKRDWRYRINSSDTLDVIFESTPEFNQTVTVQPDGYITLREIGDLPAAGQTLPELRESIRSAYSKIFRNPDISIVPKDFEKPYFVVGGQVGKPGKFDLRSDTTLTQAIAIAGGFTDASKHSQVILFRRVSDEWTEAKIIDVKKMMSAKDLREDPELKPGDMVYVPKNALSKIKPFLPTSSVGAYASPGIF